jgi:hypothetical protein
MSRGDVPVPVQRVQFRRSLFQNDQQLHQARSPGSLPRYARRACRMPLFVPTAIPAGEIVGPSAGIGRSCAMA